MTTLRFPSKAKRTFSRSSRRSLLSHPDGARRKAGADALAKVFGDNVRLFTLITNTLAKDKEISDRWRGFKDVADSRHLANRVVKPRSSMRRVIRSRRLSASLASLLRNEGALAWHGQAQPLGPQRAASRQARARLHLEGSRAHGAVGLRAVCPGDGGDRETVLRQGLVDAPVREGKAQGAFSASTVPSVHPYVLMNYQASRAM